MNEQLKKEIFRRYSKHGFNYNSWEQFKERTGFNETQKLECYYCKISLEDNKEYPHYQSLTLDHKKPKWLGGQNILSNICISCARCNTVKGTMQESTFKLFLEILDSNKEAKEKILNEIYKSNSLRDIHILQKKKVKYLWELI